MVTTWESRDNQRARAIERVLVATPQTLSQRIALVRFETLLGFSLWITLIAVILWVGQA
ncbi:MAG: hypothetical protein ACI8X5_003570 [Planctomycetota bacterium]|jgi:hypothetical protein